MPATMKPGNSTVQSELVETRLISHMATAFSASPVPSRMRIGTRADSRPAIGAATKETMLSGRKRSPVCSGVSPRMFCR